jgi:hypothetical protein
MMLLQNDMPTVSSDCQNKDTGEAGGMGFGHCIKRFLDEPSEVT